ncbi:unnamed protein product, partial [Laminaria digitata]
SVFRDDEADASLLDPDRSIRIGHDFDRIWRFQRFAHHRTERGAQHCAATVFCFALVRGLVHFIRLLSLTFPSDQSLTAHAIFGEWDCGPYPATPRDLLQMNANANL